jgi:outer membrane autotransporter protein
MDRQKNALRNKITALALAVLIACLAPPCPAAAETLADIDAVIQAGDKTLVRVPGQDAYNVYQGIDTGLLDRKIAVLTAAGIATFASAGHYGNFYSFTGLAGVTDTKIEIVTTTAPMRLYRRGNSSVQETQTYLGSWWGGEYRGIQASRDQQAILAAWGSDLNRIYVIQVPAGTTLLGGLAAPMEKNGEYRAGGAYQYYYRGAPASWLVYALYAPDYLQSYASAVTGAQKLARSGLEDIGVRLEDLRLAAGSSSARETGPWLRLYGGYTRQAGGGGDFGQKAGGLHAGWENLIKGGTPRERDTWHIGAFLGQGAFNQSEAASGVKNDLTNTYAGLYTLYRARPDRPRSWYGAAAILYGSLKTANHVPGELGYGLNQTYHGNLLAASLENGLTIRRPGDWIVEPQLGLTYAQILQSDFADNLGAAVSIKRGRSVVGRLGLLVRRSLDGPDNRHAAFWVRAGYQREICGPNIVDVAGDLASGDGGRNTCLLGIGAERWIGNRLSLRGEISKLFGGERGYRGGFSLRRLL